MIGTSIGDLKTVYQQTEGAFGILKQQAPGEEADSFSKAMADLTMKNVNPDRPDAVKATEQPKPVEHTAVNKPQRRDIEEKKDAPVAKTEKTDKKIDEKGLDEAVSEKVDKVKKAVEEELGITEEQLTEAMEALNMTPADLLDQGNVKELMMSISGVEDASELLTNEALLTGINNVLEVVSESVNELKSEFSLSDEEFTELRESFGELLEAASEKVRPEGMPEPEKPAPEPVKEEGGIRVEVRREETGKEEGIEVRDPFAGVSKAPDNGKEFSNGNTGENSGQDQQQQFVMPQTVVQTEVNSIGEVVSTVREYSSFAENAEIVNQVTEQIKVNISSESTTMEMMLHPASLGAVNVQVTQQGDVLHAQILVQNEQVKEALSTQIEQLLKTFEEQGQKVTEVEVSVADYNLEQGFEQDQGQMYQGNRNGESDASRRLRRSLNLNELSDEDISLLDEEERLTAEVMNMNGASVEYRA